MCGAKYAAAEAITNANTTGSCPLISAGSAVSRPGTKYRHAHAAYPAISVASGPADRFLLDRRGHRYRLKQKSTASCPESRRTVKTSHPLGMANPSAPTP